MTRPEVFMGLQVEMTTGALLERQAELEAVARVAARAAEGAGALCVIDGPPGAGKTSVLEAARDAAADADLLILSARGAELEQAFAYGVVRQLFDPIVRDPAIEKEQLFTGAAHHATRLLAIEPDVDPSGASQDPFATRHAVYWLTANLASQRPLAIFLDDAQWADGASLGALAHVAHRLEGLPVALVFASRTEVSGDALDTIRRQAGETGVLLTPSPLSEEAAATFVRGFEPSADDALCRACHRASGGNPFLLHELARSIAAGEADRLHPERVLDQSPERVTQEVAARLSRLTETASRLAGAAAVLGEETPLRQAAMLAQIDAVAAAEAADALVAAGLLRSAQPLGFMHPLVRAAVYASIGPAARASDHARAARLLAEEGAPPERVAAQLLWCQPAGDQWACQQLLAAAQLAATRGSPEAAAKYLRRALDEPPPPAARAQIVLHLGAAEAMAAELEAAMAHLHEALAAEIGPEQRLGATMLLSGLLGHAYRAAEAADVVEEQLPALVDHPELQATAAAAFANVTRIDPATRPRAASTIAELRSRVGDGGVSGPAVLGTVATEMMIAGEPADEMARLAERALARIDWATMAVADWVGFIAARCLVMAERYETARTALDDALEVLRERGAMFDLGGAFAFRSELHLRTGDLESAEVDARTLMEIAGGSGWTGGQGFATAWLGEVFVERGELEEAERLLEADAINAMTRGYTAGEVLLARGRARLAGGRVEEAIEALRACGEWSTGVGIVNPAGFPWRSWLAHALLDEEQTEEAGRLATEELELAREFGTPRALAIALRAAARAEGGEGEIGMLREAVEVLDGSPAQLECARVHQALGAALRREGQAEDAREPLRVAVDLAHRCGADALADRALEELRTTGARPRRRQATGAGALTPSERRIAGLAAGGQQNREIAEALFVTTNTVEYHLRNAYRKLGIKGRTELDEALETSEAEPQDS